MAQKTRTTLSNDSDSIFLDNTSGQIIPANHRDFNDDIIDSCANLEDNNIFDGDNQFTGMFQADGAATFNDTATFNGESTFNDKVTHAAQVVSGYAGATIASAATIDLTNVDGNLIFITGTTEINTITGNIGAIFYCTFVDGTTIVPSGTSIQPAKSLAYNGGDTIIFVIQASNQIRILGRYRDGGPYSEQSYFYLNYANFDLLFQNSLLQVGAIYYIPDVPNNTGFPGTDWQMKVRAMSSGSLDRDAMIFLGSLWVRVDIQANDVNNILIYGTDAGSAATALFSISDFQTYNSPQLFMSQSEVVLGFALESYFPASFGYSRFVVNNSATVPLLNIINHYNDGHSLKYIGQTNICYRNDGSQSINTNDYGTNPDFGNLGVDANALFTYNTNTKNNPINDLFTISINYQLVNNLVTIMFECSFRTPFDAGDCGHSAFLYLPLPFQKTTSIFLTNGNGIGHGSLRFLDICNHMDIGVIASSTTDPYGCVFEAKYSNGDSSPTDVIMSGTFSYHTMNY